MAALICLPDNPCVTDIHNNRSGSWQSVFTQTRQVSASIRPQPRLISPSERGACTPQPCPPPGTCWALVRLPSLAPRGRPDTRFCAFQVSSARPRGDTGSIPCLRVSVEMVTVPGPPSRRQSHRSFQQRCRPSSHSGRRRHPLRAPLPSPRT